LYGKILYLEMYNQQLMSSSLIKVVIAPWGNPFGWQEATYSFEGQKVKAKTTLDVWLQTLKPNKVCLIVPDTVLADSYINHREFKKFEERGYCFFKEKVHYSIQTFLNKNVKSFNCEQVKIYINYNTGTYSYIKFDRDANNYYQGLIWIFYKFFIEDLKILEIAENSQKANKKLILEVYLDTTHGVNFMPTLTLEALQKFLKTLSALPIDIKLKVYNAEPVQPFTSNEVSELLLIYEESYRKVFTELTFTNKQKWADKLIDNFKNVLLFLAGVIKGYPLLIYNNFDLKVDSSKADIEVLDEDFIKKEIQNYEKNIELQIEYKDYKYPENVPDFFKNRSEFKNILDLENKGLIKVRHFEWKKLYLEAIEKEKLKPYMDMLVLTLLLKRLLEKIYSVKHFEEKVSIQEIEKLLTSLYEETPLESYISHNWNTFKNDDLKRIPTDQGAFNLRSFQSHLGLLMKTLDKEEENQETFIKWKKSFDKDKLQSLLKEVIKNDIFGFPISKDNSS